MSTRVVILGAGFGGLQLSTRLSTDLGDQVEVTLIDKSDAFVFGFAKLDVMFGRHALDDVRLHYRTIDKPRVTFVQTAVRSIDPVAKQVVTDAGQFGADVVVVALGADLAPELTPGLVECGYEYYSPEGAGVAREAIADFAGGDVIIGVLGGHFKCPPAPYETAFMLHDDLLRRGLRDRTTIHLVTPMPKPIPVSAAVSDSILAAMDERGITYQHATWCDGLDPTTRTARLRDGSELPFDLFLAVPRHVAPPVVVESGLTESDGWIAVDPATLETKFPDVFAIGDVASVPVPRAGVIAEGEANTVADVLRHRIAGGPAPSPFPGVIVCYIEMGDDQIGRVDVNFLGGPRPSSVFVPPSLAGAEEKQAWAAARRRDWFGLDQRA